MSEIVILGAARSGTHFLAKTITSHFDVNYIGESNDIWRMAQKRSSDDFICASMLNERTISRIRQKFDTQRVPGKFLLEKTPANTLRPELVAAVFPQAKFIHIVRDGRDVVLSALRKYEGDVRKVTQTESKKLGRLEALLHPIKYKLSKGVGIRDVFQNAGHYANTTLNALGLKRYLWGPKFPGWGYCLKFCSRAEIAALQWRYSVITTRNFLQGNRHVQVLELRYEDLLADTQGTVKKIEEFLGIPASNSAAETQVEKLTVRKAQWKTKMDRATLAEVSSLVEAELVALGYQPSTPNDV